MTLWNCFKSRSLVAAVLALFLYEIILTPTILALTSGPSQPEVQSFDPVSTTELVNPFTGDFTYNIPLLDIGGYPINLTYHSGVTMDQEASFVGLGWNLNPGVINRNIRGLPDDFSGDEIRKELHLKPNTTAGATVGVGLEVFGYDGFRPGLNIGLNHNSYHGAGIDFGFSAGVSAGEGASTSLTLGLGVSSNSGVTLNPSVSFSKNVDSAVGRSTFGGGVGISLNSREGLQALTLRRDFNRNWNMASRLSFGTGTYTPTITTPMRSASLSFSVRVGGEIFGTTGNIDVVGYRSEQVVAEPQYTIPGYGYLYAHKAGEATRVLHDFNREKDGNFHPNQPNLPLTQATYDLYAVSGHGMQGQFRPFRSDIGTVFDHHVSLSGITGASHGWEIAGGNSAKGGANLVVNTVNSQAGKWATDNLTTPIFRFRGLDTEHVEYEPVYFKQIGETSAMSQSNRQRFFEAVGGFDPVRIKLNGHQAIAELETTSSDPPPLSPLTAQITHLTDREPRNLHLSFLTASEAGEFGLEKTIRNYQAFWELYDEPTRATTKKYDEDSRVNEKRRPHHMSEITTIRGDGARYIYGLPIYNMVKEEVSFNASDCNESVCNNVPSFQEGLVTYRSGIDDSSENTNEINRYFHKVATPPYAYAYLLTAVVSPDYVDRAGDGPTSDDLGTYTKFNYRQYHERYRWRTPYTEKISEGPSSPTSGKASFVRGQLADPYDDTGSYVYGEKEIWYLHSIESKNYVAEFRLSPREDGIAVQDRHGGTPTVVATASAEAREEISCSSSDFIPPSTDSQRLYKLDCIQLFNKAERIAKKDQAVPIKTVHFFYDYSLAPNVANAAKTSADSSRRLGKLTLKRLAFSYRDSQKALLSPYIFTYANLNPHYEQQATDRWGTYQPNNANRPNGRFPYTEQRPALGHWYATAWHLTGIRLPSGGRLTVDYEADDYAYVQDRRSMQMFPIVGTGVAGEEEDGNTNCQLRANALYEGTDDHLCLFFDLNEPLTMEQTAELEEYIRDLKSLYVNASVHVDERDDVTTCEEREEHKICQEIQTFLPLDRDTETGVPKHGFDLRSEIDDRGTNRYTRAWIKVKGAQNIPGGIDPEGNPVTRENIHPLAKATWQYIRLNLPKIAYPQPDQSDINDLVSGNPTTLVVALPRLIGGFFTELWAAITGFNNKMLEEERANRIDLATSFMRLNHPTKQKIGGGSRVKRITLNDQWGRMSQHTRADRERVDTSYIQEYSYTIAEQQGNGTQAISSGVAAYEPLVGGDENPFVEPMWYEHNDDQLFQLGPIGESFYSSPVVGYRRVTVRHLTPDPRIPGTGSTVYEFHTAKEFPVRVQYTNIRPYTTITPDILLPIPLSLDKRTVSQGYVIELNDMHGKPKATWVFQEGPAREPISGYSYHYLTSETDLTQRKNIRKTLVKTESGGAEVVEQPIGLTYDVMVDAREHFTNVSAPGGQINADGFLAGVFPIVVPMPYPEYSSESTRFRSAVITKAIYRTGLLHEVRAHDSGASLSTFNEVWDAETGNVVITRTQTEHGTYRYTTRIPAHFEELGMGGAWMNQGLRANGLFLPEPGVLVANNAALHLVAGDELMLRPSQDSDSLCEAVSGSDPVEGFHAWVWRVEEGRVRLIDRNGDPIPAVVCPETGATRPLDIKIIRSGHRNQQTLDIGHVTTLSSPLNAGERTLKFEKILDTAAREYAQHWQSYGPYKLSNQPPTCQCESLNFRRVPPTTGAEPSPSHVALVDLLRELQRVDHLETRLVELAPLLMGDAVREDLSGVREYLNERLPGWSHWKGQREGSMFTGTIANIEGEPLCSVTLRNPRGELTEAQLDALRFDTMDYRRVDPSACGSSSHFLMLTGTGETQEAIYGESSCFPIRACKIPMEVFLPQYQCELPEGTTVNPFVEGILGNWRPYKSWAYLTNRVPFKRSIEAGLFEVREVPFQPFWSRFENHSRDRWHWTEKTTVIDPFGQVKESQDALRRYAAQLAGFQFSVPKAVAGNSRASQIAVEDFEDYGYTNLIQPPGTCTAPTHWSFQYRADPSSVDSTQSHSGRHSLRLNRESISLARAINPPCDQGRTIPTTPVYRLQHCDLIQPFSPLPGDYLISAWVQTSSRPGSLPDLVPDAGPRIKITTGGLQTEFEPSGIATDGWQRIWGEFSVSETAGSIDVQLISGDVVAWFDDIRIHPFDAQMDTYVYDSIDLRFRASLDTHNYSTFYDYDEEGALSRVKQETVEGTMTIKEASRGAPKYSENP